MGNEYTVKIGLPTMRIDWHLKQFLLTVDCYDAASAITQMENAIKKLKQGDVSFGRGSTMIENVVASYSYPHRPHCSRVSGFIGENPTENK